MLELAVEMNLDVYFTVALMLICITPGELESGQFISSAYSWYKHIHVPR